MTNEAKRSRDGESDAVQEALKSVERLAAEEEFDVDGVEVLKSSEAPPAGDERAASPADEELERQFAGRSERSLEGEAAVQSFPDEEAVLLDDDVAPAAPAKKPSAQNAMLEAMIQAKNEALAALEQTQKEAKTMQERLLRVTADFENFKKRQAREKDEAVKYANERMLKEVLPVLDNADRALQAVRQSGQAEMNEAIKNLTGGMEMVFKQLADTFGKFGVEGFAALGTPFNPALHEAVAQREDPSVPSGTVVEEYQKGYLLHGRLVRPAMVVVSTGGSLEGAAVNDGGAAASDREGSDSAE
ncbi:MAG: nucleotide exchange factor GrpE [Myxococcota bacterium]